MPCFPFLIFLTTSRFLSLLISLYLSLVRLISAESLIHCSDPQVLSYLTLLSSLFLPLSLQLSPSPLLALSPRRNAGARCGHAAAADLIHCGLGSPRAGRRKRLPTETPSSFFFSFSSSLYLSVALALHPSLYAHHFTALPAKADSREPSSKGEERERERERRRLFLLLFSHSSLRLSPSLPLSSFFAYGATA